MGRVSGGGRGDLKSYFRSKNDTDESGTTRPETGVDISIRGREGGRAETEGYIE